MKRVAEIVCTEYAWCGSNKCSLDCSYAWCEFEVSQKACSWLDCFGGLANITVTQHTIRPHRHHHLSNSNHKTLHLQCCSSFFFFPAHNKHNNLCLKSTYTQRPLIHTATLCNPFQCTPSTAPSSLDVYCVGFDPMQPWSSKFCGLGEILRKKLLMPTTCKRIMWPEATLSRRVMWLQSMWFVGSC